MACGEFYFMVRCQSCGNVFRSYITCKKRTCEKCSRVRSVRLVNAYYPVVLSFTWPAFMTLTLPWVESKKVREQKDRLVDSFAKLRRWKEIGFKKGIYTIEILKKDGDFWYLHLHALIDCKWLDQKRLSEIWKKITGDASIVDIRRINNTKKACMEVIKYQTKMWELTDDEKLFVDQIFTHSRFVGSFGIDIPESKSHANICPLCGGKLEICEDWRSDRPVLREETFYNDR